MTATSKRLYSALATLLIVSITGCASTQSETSSNANEKNDFQRITTLEEYTSSVVGRKIVLGGKEDTTTTHADGTMTGMFKGKPIVGTWEWENGYFCREMKIGDQVRKRDCQLMEVSGNSIRVIRNEGKGDTATYKLN